MIDRIEFESGLNVYLVYKEPFTEHSKMTVITPNFENLSEQEVIYSLEHIVSDPHINPFCLNVEDLETAIDESYDDEDSNFLDREGIPRNIKQLFETKEINPNGFQDLSKKLSKTVPIKLFAVDSEDPSYWFGELDLNDRHVAEYVLNHKMGYMLTKLTLKDNSIVLRLLVSPIFSLKRTENGEYVIFVSHSENQIEFKPYKIKKKRKTKC